jgi:hypothetical protein
MGRPTNESKQYDMNDHARILFAAAPPPLNDILPELCQTMGVQPWHLIIGHLIKADQRAELHAPLLMEEWTETSPVAPNLKQGRVCPSCKRALVTHPNAAYCCNFCGSGRYQQDQQHHPDCEFFVKPQRHVTLPDRKAVLPVVPPEDPLERLQFEESAFHQHLQDVTVAENAPGGLPPLPDDLDADPRAAWVGKKR